MNSQHLMSIAIMVVGLAATLFGAYISMLMLLRPEDYQRYLNRRLWKGSDPNPRYKSGAGTIFGTRVVAAVLLALWVLFALRLGAALFGGPQISFVTERSSPSRSGAAPTHLLILGLGLLGAGLFILFRTDSFVRWSVRTFAKRIVRDEAIPRSILMARVMAGLLILGALDNLVTWLRFKS